MDMHEACNLQALVCMSKLQTRRHLIIILWSEHMISRIVVGHVIKNNPVNQIVNKVKFDSQRTSLQ